MLNWWTAEMHFQTICSCCH